MYKCPFMPCMDCPYYAEHKMRDMNQMQDNQSVSGIPNIPPSTEIPNMYPIQNVEQMNNNVQKNQDVSNTLKDDIKDDDSEAFIRVLHASPDAPPVDVFIDGSKAIDDLAYGMLAGYMPISGGKHKIEVFPSNKTKNPVISVSMAFADDTFSTFAAVGKVANIEPLIIDDYEDKVPRNQALVKFVHMSPNAPAVDITLSDGKKLFTNISFKQATDYIMVNPGQYALQVRLSGTNTVVLDVPKMSVQGGVPYSIYAIGLAGGKPPLTAVLVEDEI